MKVVLRNKRNPELRSGIFVCAMKFAAAHPPAVLLDAEPVDRGRAARRARPGGRRLHRLLAAGPGRADRQVPGRGAGRGPRAAQNGSLSSDQISERTLAHVRALAAIAASRGQSLAQLALSWALQDQRVTSVLIGASSVAQLEENLAAADHTGFGATRSWPRSTATPSPPASTSGPTPAPTNPRSAPLQFNERGVLPNRGGLSKSHMSPGNLSRRLRIEATYSL